MKKIIFITLIVFAASLSSTSRANAQVIEVAKIIQEGVKKVIRAVDLKIQRLQNETIWLQNAQKALENALSKLKLDEISDWVDRQRTIYAEYFDELHKVRTIIAYYHKIKAITEKQVNIVEHYKKAFALFKRDDHFTMKEIEYMEKVYSGIFEESLQNLDQLFLVINSFSTSMTDAERLVIIDEVNEQINRNYYDLIQFNEQNKLISLQRAKSQQEIQATKALYGLE